MYQASLGSDGGKKARERLSREAAPLVLEVKPIYPSLFPGLLTFVSKTHQTQSQWDGKPQSGIRRASTGLIHFLEGSVRWRGEAQATYQYTVRAFNRLFSQRPVKAVGNVRTKAN